MVYHVVLMCELCCVVSIFIYGYASGFCMVHYAVFRIVLVIQRDSTLS